MRAERSRRLRQLGVVHPDLARPAHLAAGLNQRAIAFLLLRRHLVIGDLGIAAKSRRVGHRAFLFGVDCVHLLPLRSTHVDGPLPDIATSLAARNPPLRIVLRCGLRVGLASRLAATVLALASESMRWRGLTQSPARSSDRRAVITRY